MGRQRDHVWHAGVAEALNVANATAALNAHATTQHTRLQPRPIGRGDLDLRVREIGDLDLLTLGGTHRAEIHPVEGVEVEASTGDGDRLMSSGARVPR